MNELVNIIHYAHADGDLTPCGKKRARLVIAANGAPEYLCMDCESTSDRRIEYQWVRETVSMASLGE